MTNPRLKEEEQKFLLGLTNLASKQFAEGIDSTTLLNYITGFIPRVPLIKASELCKNGLPEMRVGITIPSLPLIEKASGGVMGMWIIGGQPGLGKSCLAWQISLEVGKHIPVLAYDLELGSQEILYRVSKICYGNIEQVRKALQRVYIRDSISTLEADIQEIKAPALILVDSIQKAPTNLQQRRGSLDKYLNRLETLTKQGYTVILVSELNRQFGGEPTVNSFKESSELGYSCSFGITLMEREDNSVGVLTVKNRHRPQRGFITAMLRDDKKTWWFKEI